MNGKIGIQNFSNIVLVLDMDLAYNDIDSKLQSKLNSVDIYAHVNIYTCTPYYSKYSLSLKASITDQNQHVNPLEMYIICLIYNIS